MDGDGLRILATLLVGFVTGIVSAMFGIGGGVVAKPAIRGLGATPLETVGSTLPAVIPSALSGTIRYAREGLVSWPITARVAGLGAVFAVVGALVSEALPGDGRVLMIAVAVVVGYTAARIALDQTEALASSIDDADHHRTSSGIVGSEVVAVANGQALVIGAAAGIVSGMLGLGGGIVIVPALARWVGLPIKISVATSLACVGLIAIPGTVTHAILGNINWAFAIPLALGVIPGAWFGAHLTIRADERALRLAVGCVLGAVAIVSGVSEILALI